MKKMKKAPIGIGICSIVLGTLILLGTLFPSENLSSEGLLPFVLPAYLIGFLVIFIPYQRSKKAERQQIGSSVDLRHLIIGMSKADGKIDLQDLCKRMGMKFDALKFKIYELIGAGKVEGKIEGTTFTLTGDIAATIDALLSEFDAWGKGGKKAN